MKLVLWMIVFVGNNRDAKGKDWSSKKKERKGDGERVSE